MAAMYKTPTLKTPKLQTPVYNDKKYSKGFDSSYYTNAINQNAAQVNKERNIQLGEAQKQQQGALRNAYLQRVQNQRTLNDSMAAAGIRGGASETSNLKLANQYGTAVQAANTDYTNAVNSINQAADRNIYDFRMDMTARAEEARRNFAQSQWQAAREDSINKYNAKREDALTRFKAKSENAVNQYNATNEYWNNYYLDYYSGMKKKDLDKHLKNAKKQLKKAKTQSEKIRIQQKIRGIQARRGVINNK